MLVRTAMFIVVVGFAWGASAQPLGDDRYQLSVVTTVQASSNTVDLATKFDSVSGTNGAPDSMLGWSYGVCHDSSALTLTSAADGMTTATVNAGLPPDFNSLSLEADGFTVGVVISFAINNLPPGTNYELNVATYDVVGIPGTMTTVEICGTLGVPQVDTTFVEVGAMNVVPVQFPSQLVLPLPGATPDFTRGDCNADGTTNIGDAVFLLTALFPPAIPPTLPCADACDANDDGSNDLADAIALLGSLFGIPAVILPTPTNCGPDPTTADPLDCDMFPACP